MTREDNEEPLWDFTYNYFEPLAVWGATFSLAFRDFFFWFVFFAVSMKPYEIYVVV